jgi:hypothetical protein
MKRIKGTYAKLTLLAWLSIIGFDFFLHAGVLARLYVEPSPFLLPPERAFVLVPVGYLSFLVITILLIWLMARLGIQGWHQGAVFGLKLGALSWGALTLGLFSISTASPTLLIGWFLGQTVELGIAGVVAGSGFAGARLGRLLLKVLAFVIGVLVITILLQSLGLAPAHVR